MRTPLIAARAFGALVVLMLLSACPSLGPQTGAVPSTERAERLERQGDFAGAARIYEGLARENSGPDAVGFAQRAARAWLAGQRPEDAARILRETANENRTPAQRFEGSMLDIEIALARGQGAQAWQLLGSLPEPSAAADARRYFELRERAAFATGRPVEGVRAAVTAERFAASPEERNAIRARLLGELRAASERGVRLDPAAATEPVVRGWLELGPIAAAAARNPLTAPSAVSAWRKRYPTHPGIEVARREILAEAAGPGGAAQPLGPHVALLLPVTGPFASAGGTVRDGFLAAYYGTPVDTRLPLRVHDTGELSVGEALERAAAEGAEIIVGPLTREEVIAASDFTARRPPLLVLNFLPAERGAPQRFYQFALSPEDEARAVARRVLAAGQRRGVILAPEGDWGARVASAFRDELLAGGGEVLADSLYGTGRSDYGQWIQPALRLADSRARHRRLEEILGTKLQFEPRRRGDIDFIFAPAQAGVARMMRPQLRFHYAGDIPTYATSDAFEPDERANQDLDGLTFPDMPWMVGSDELVERARGATRAAWANGGPRRGRLFAFGYDAYRLAEALRAGRLGASGGRIDGLTGDLSLDPEGKVRRELEWAQLRGGQPRLLPPTP